MPTASSPEVLAVTTRRRVVGTGARLAYAAPLVAATMRLGARGAAALSPVAEVCAGNQSPKQCPEGSKVQYTCKSATTCPAEFHGDVEVRCRADGTPFCARGPEHEDLTAQGCLPLLCANRAG